MCAPLPQTTEILHWRRGEALIMATHGSIGEYNSTREDWLSYTERLIQYFVANGISEEGDKRRAILLSSCGAATYQLIHNLVAPDKPMDKTFAELVASLLIISPALPPSCKDFIFIPGHRSPASQ